MKSGKWVQIQQNQRAKAFIPYFLPLKSNLQIPAVLLSKANRFLGRLDGISELLPDLDFFIFMYIKKEATASSQIEGTSANLTDLLKSEARIKDPTIPLDVKEIINYINALNYGIERIKELPLSLRLIREIHSILLKDVRGEDKAPGDFRKSQNWIGAKIINSATYVPPPPNELYPLLDNFEKFLHLDLDIPILIKTALIHYQFELIHPFLDGNGRIGRLLITLYLYERDILKYPLLYLSDYFRKYRSQYYDKLDNISKKGEVEEWIKFFLEAIMEISKEAVELSRKINELKNRDTEKIIHSGKIIKNATMILKKLFNQPFITAKTVKDLTQLSTPNANNLIHHLLNLEILQERQHRKRNRVFCYSDYLKLF